MFIGEEVRSFWQGWVSYMRLSDLLPAGGEGVGENITQQEKFLRVFGYLVYTYKKGGGCLISTAV